jgi:hypothetical protein
MFHIKSPTLFPGRCEEEEQRTDHPKGRGCQGNEGHMPSVQGKSSAYDGQSTLGVPDVCILQGLATLSSVVLQHSVRAYLHQQRVYIACALIYLTRILYLDKFASLGIQASLLDNKQLKEHHENKHSKLPLPDELKEL